MNSIDTRDRLLKDATKLAKAVIKNWRKGGYSCNFCSGTDGKHTPSCATYIAKRILEENDD